jgi:hypothetical protein
MANYGLKVTNRWRERARAETCARLSARLNDLLRLGAVQFRRGAMREVLTPDQRTKMRDQRRGAGWRRVVL